MSDHPKNIIILPLGTSVGISIIFVISEIELREPVYSSIYFMLTLVIGL